MKSLNKTETPIFLSVVCSLFPKAIFMTCICCDCHFVIFPGYLHLYFCAYWAPFGNFEYYKKVIHEAILAETSWCGSESITFRLLLVITKTITKTCLFKYIENFTTKKWKFSDKKYWYFSYFCSKHRLWVLVRTASPNIDNLCLSRNKKNNVYPCKPQFY